MQDQQEAVRPETRLEKLKEICLQCRQCHLYQSRKNLVFGEGSPTAWVMFIGEAPGKDEDLTGRPFVGKSGALLRNTIQAIGLDVSRDVYIANVLKDRPPLNRDPNPEEVEPCIKFLKKQIEIIQPQLLVLLGRFAFRGLLPEYVAFSISRMRELSTEIGKLMYSDIPVIVTYHPSALLRNPGYKPCWKHDFTLIRSFVEELKEIELPV